MNNVIHQIIDLDQRASKIKQSAENRAQKIENDAQREISQSRDQILDRAKADSIQNYKIEIEKANGEKDETIDKMNAQLNNMRNQYEKIKDKSARQVLETLFKTI